MRVELHSKGLEVPTEVAGHLNTRLHFALSRFAHRVVTVRATLLDVNGPRGGIDKTCRVHVAGDRIDAVVVEVKDRSILAAIDRAADRAARAVARAIERGNWSAVPSRARGRRPAKGERSRALPAM